MHNQQNFIGGVAAVVLPSLVTTIAEAVIGKLVQSPSVPIERVDVPVVRPKIQEAVAEAIRNDPVIKNELNAEAPHQSRVLWGNFFAAVGTLLSGAMPVAVALGLISQEDAKAIIDGWGAIVPAFGAVVAMGGVAYSVYGRLASGLKPLFSRK